MMKLGPEPPATVVTTHNMCDKDVTTWSSLLGANVISIGSYCEE